MTVRSLTAKLALGVALLVLLSIGLMAGLAVWRSAEALRERALATNHTVALGVSYAVEQYVADAMAIMREAAERPKLRHEITSGNWHEARTVLENVARHFRQFDYVFVQDAQGIIRARVPHAETVGEDFSSRDFFREAMRTRQPYLSGVYVSKATQRPVVATAVPVLHADGRVAGVLVGALSLQTMNRLVSVAAHDDGRAIYLVDSQGRLIADSRAVVESLRDMRAEPVVQAVLSKRAGTMIFRGPGRGDEMLGAYVPIKPFDWGVVVIRSTAAAQAPAARLGSVLIWIAVGCTVGAIAVGVGFARRLTRPLLRLAEASKRIAAGELSTRVAVSGQDEVATLARAFNQMADAVAQSHQALAQRAAEVETMNRKLIEEAAVRQQAEAATRHQAERLAILHEIDRGLLAAETPAVIAEATLGRVRQLLGVPRAIVNLFDLEAGEVEWLAAAGRRRVHVGPGVRFPLALMGDVAALRRGELQMIDVDALPRSPEAEALLASGVHVYMVVPMIAGGELIGALSFGGGAGPFSPEQVSIASEVAAQIAIAIAQSRLYERVKRQAMELEQRVQERTQELEAANQELDTFSYSISHDLRAPLRAMQGFTEALLEDYGERLDSTGQDYAQRIVAASHRMDALIQDLLAYSRLSRTEVRLDPVNVETVVDEVCGQLATELKDRGAEITVDRPLARVMAHRAVFGQVLANLLTNAVKFVAPDTPPRVRIWTELRGDWVRLGVEDNGIGIIAEHRERIFRAFERLHGVEQYPGTGIGLAIVQKGIARLGGQVGVESTLGQGSRFWVELKSAEA
ncbi:MAG: cache domain-containing protein [Candidatus Rokubacteria bacterium]|nr:cache domain-containing protein [Candidatus Rokubacteria bacterium]